MSYNDKIKLNIFEGETTYQHDYKKFPAEPKKVNKNELHQPKEIEMREYPRRDNHTFTYLRENVHVPFNLFWRPKEITNTNPYEPFEIPVLPERDPGKEVIKTRPRVYMSPAVSMDDIEDPEMRKLLCSYTYTSEWAKAIEESAVQAAKRDIPNTTVEHSGDPVRLKIDTLPPLPENFRNKGEKWENAQVKGTVDPTRTFWENKDPSVKCGACFDPIEGLVPKETKEKIEKLIETNKLRLPHDLPKPGYGGYRPMMTFGVPLEKQDLPVIHPLLTVQQAVNKRFSQDKSN